MRIAAPTLTAVPSNLNTQRLDKAAHQFEAMLLGELLKPLGKPEDAEGGSSDDTSGSNPMQSFGVQALASNLAQSGALGFAGRIERALQAHVAPTENKASPPAF